MMNANPLNQLKSQSTAPTDSKAHHHYEKGMDILLKVHAQNFENPYEMLEALEEFIKVITLDSDDIRPYLACCYIFILVNDFVNATSYILAAKQVDKTNPIIPIFEEMLLASQKRVQTPQSTNTPEPSTLTEDIDFDALYDELELYIIDATKNAMSTRFPTPTEKEDKYCELKELQLKFKEQVKYIQRELKVIDHEIEISELYLKYRPITIVLNRINKNVKRSQSLVKLENMILKEIDAINLLCRYVSKFKNRALPQLDVTLEKHLDRCDRIADQLDYLHDEKVYIKGVEVSYEKLIEVLQIFQGMLEEI